MQVSPGRERQTPGQQRVDRTECLAQTGWVESLAGLALGLPPASKGPLMSRGAQKLGWGGGGLVVLCSFH